MKSLSLGVILHGPPQAAAGSRAETVGTALRTPRLYDTYVPPARYFFTIPDSDDPHPVKNAILHTDAACAAESDRRTCLLNKRYVSHLGTWTDFARRVWPALPTTPHHLTYIFSGPTMNTSISAHTFVATGNFAMIKLLSTGFAVILGISLCVAPQTAHAQSDSDAMLGLTTTVGTTTLIGLAGVGIYASTKRDDRRAAAAMHYLRQRSFQVRQDICLGRGPVLEELGRSLRVGALRRAPFARALRHRRRELLSLANPAQLTPGRALRFFNIVEESALVTARGGSS